jgi:protease I
MVTFNPTTMVRITPVMPAVTNKERIMDLRGKRVAILVEDNYKALEVWYPLLRFREAEAAVTVVGPRACSYTSTQGIPIQADVGAEQVQAEDFEAIVIPSGTAAEAISQHPPMLALIHEALRQHKVVATIVQARGIAGAAPDGGAGEHSHMLEEMLKDERPPEINAVTREGNLIKARLPVDLATFCRMIIAALSDPPPPD